MADDKEKREKKASFVKEIFLEIRDSILGSIIFEVIWNILMFIPRMLIRLIKEIL
jgi:hypothetical protein